jgi:predicted amidohydrolase
MAFREGFKLPIAQTDIGNIGMMIGYDLAFPEVARTLTLEGADLLLCMANWETAQMDEWKTYVRARAYENSVFVAAVNRVGEDVTLSFGGESMVVGPRGQVYASLAEDTDSETGAPKEGFVIAKIDLTDVRKYREEFQFIQNRQPLAYRRIVKKY